MARHRLVAADRAPTGQIEPCEFCPDFGDRGNRAWPRRRRKGNPVTGWIDDPSLAIKDQFAVHAHCICAGVVLDPEVVSPSGRPSYIDSARWHAPASSALALNPVRHADRLSPSRGCRRRPVARPQHGRCTRRSGRMNQRSGRLGSGRHAGRAGQRVICSLRASCSSC